LPSPIALAIPFFFLLMGVEWLVARRRGLSLYRFSDALVDLSCGMTQQIILVFWAGALVAGYQWLYQFRLLNFDPASAVPWAIAFFAIDFTYYWWHRFSHEVNFMWAVHVVHHQSEDYNLAVALRQAIFSVWTIWPFHLALAVFGLPPLVVFVVESLSTLYQFWIHTELIGDLGLFERVFNTPAQHRVHHAVNPQYLDKNYGATLCVWDRLFGTYEPQVEQPVYGLVHPQRSFNPLWAQVSHFVTTAQRARGLKGWDRLRVWFKPPGWGSPPPKAVTRAGQHKFDVPLSSREVAGLAVGLGVAVCGTTALLWLEDGMNLPAKAGMAAIPLLLIGGWGALLDRRAA